jgi:hypothetical protein
MVACGQITLILFNPTANFIINILKYEQGLSLHATVYISAI